MRVSVYHSVRGFSHINSLYTGSSIENQNRMCNKLNTLPSGHVKRCDCYAMHRWGVMYFSVFTHKSYTCVSQLFCILSRLSTPWSRTFPDHTFLELYDCYKVTRDSDTPLFFLWSLPSVETMVLRWSEWKMIFCVSYVQIHILMSNNCEAEILDCDSDVPTASPRKQFWSVP